jgi:exodeoxyribonuclease-3
MKLISWNVNGVRAAIGRGLLGAFEEMNPDVLCLQEVKALPEQVEACWPEGYFQYWNPAEKLGYSGTAVFSRLEPLAVETGIGLAAGDCEGRVITLEFPSFYLVNVYTPNSKRDLSRLSFRTRRWDIGFLRHLKRLEEDKPVVFCGDLNAAHEDIDLANPRSNRRNAGFTDEERRGIRRYIRSGFIDTFRQFHREGGHYSWWSYRADARARNIGWRLDYFFISGSLRPRLEEAFILPDVTGSDHCPVGICFTPG